MWMPPSLRLGQHSTTACGYDRRPQGAPWYREGRVAALLREHASEFIEAEVFDIGIPVAQMGGLAARAADNQRSGHH
jgi:hypothetical protein